MLMIIIKPLLLFAYMDPKHTRLLIKSGDCNCVKTVSIAVLRNIPFSNCLKNLM